ncbi:MAG TPA: HEAT repeat domain-containing protein, partial [Pirellulales bacterium]|nr:HEAT repeat domain-containing protein [Pirellulales bacterium]
APSSRDCSRNTAESGATTSMMHAWAMLCVRIAVCALLLASLPACTSTMKPDWSKLAWWKKEEPVEQGPTIATPKDRITKLHQLAHTASERGPAQLEGESQDLVSVLRKEEDPLIRAEILRTLAYYPTASAAKMLTAGLKDTDSDVRIACCQAWGQRKGHDATRLLSETLTSDTDIDVRLAAARALGETGDPAAATALGLALDNPDPAMQYRAVQSLRKVTGRDYDDNVAVWRDYLKGNHPPEPSLATRIKNWF